jgi:hypothetical protein
VQKGHGDEALLLVWSNSSEAANRRLVRSKAVRSAAERWEGEALWVAASSVTSGAGIRGGGQPTWGGDDRRPPALSCSPRGERGQNANGLLTSGPGLVKYNFKFPNSTQICKFKKEVFPCSKNIRTLHAARFEYFEQLS